MRKIFISSLTTLTLIAISVSLNAADLVGTYTGKIDGIVDGRSSMQTLVGFQVKKQMGAAGEIKVLTLPVTIEIQSQNGNALTGSWTTGEQSIAFVCAVSGNNNLYCADDEGHSTGSVSGSTLSVCRTESGKTGKSAVCGELIKN
jgi:hypothetical protein